MQIVFPLCRRCTSLYYDYNNVLIISLCAVFLTDLMRGRYNKAVTTEAIDYIPGTPVFV